MATQIRLSRLRPRVPKAMPKAVRQRQFHSHDHPAPPGPFSPTEAAVLSASLAHVPSHGFTLSSLALGARDCGYLPASTNLFPKGAFDLVRFYLYTQRQALSQRHDILQPEHPTGVGAKVKALAWARLTSNQRVIHRLQEAYALMAKPTNLPASLQELHALSDEIWFLSGDVSVDTSWYTKRASLATIYASTELFMTADKSPDYKDTHQFLDRRFEDAFELGKFAGGLGQWLGFNAGAVVNILRSKGARI